MKKGVYKNEAAKAAILKLYDQKLAACNFETLEHKAVSTSYGATNVIVTGNLSAPPFLILHGVNAGAPLALEAVQSLANDHCIYAVDTIGQATKSASTTINVKDDSFGHWLVEVLDALNLKQVPIVGVSYGAFLLQRLINVAPERVHKAIFMVPAGFVDGHLGASMRQLTWPLMRFMITKKEKHLKSFLGAFCSELDEHTLALHRQLLTGIHMDYRRPPLLQSETANKFKGAAYLMVAEDDIFFPTEKLVPRCQQLFPNLNAIHILKGSKHVPARAQYDEIAQCLHSWLS